MDVQLSKMRFWHFDNRTFGFQGTSVLKLKHHPCYKTNCHLTFVIGVTLLHENQSSRNSRDDDLVFLDRPLEKIDERHESESETEHDVTTLFDVTEVTDDNVTLPDDVAKPIDVTRDLDDATTTTTTTTTKPVEEKDKDEILEITTECDKGSSTVVEPYPFLRILDPYFRSGF